MHRTLTRRRILGAALGLWGHAYAVAGARTPEDALLERAISAAGGTRALDRARVLTWTGEARIFAGDRRIELGVETTVEPFTYARSDTWELAKGRASMRSLEIDGDQGRLIKDRVCEPASEVDHRSVSKGDQALVTQVCDSTGESWFRPGHVPAPIRSKSGQSSTPVYSQCDT